MAGYLLFICAIVLSFAAIMAGALWYSNRNQLLKNLFCFWISTFFSFAMQSSLADLDWIGFVAFASTGFSVYFLIKLFTLVTHTQFYLKTMIISLILSFAVSLMCFSLSLAYNIAVVPFCLTCGLLLLVAAYRGFRSDKGIFVYLFQLMLLVHSIQIVSYPYFSSHVELGNVYIISELLFYFICALFIPFFLIKNMSEELTDQLLSEVENRTFQLRSANEKLLEANGKLEKINSELEELSIDNKSLLNILVHDLANPLQILNMSIYKLAMSSLPSPLGELADRSNKALMVVNEILVSVRRYHTIKIGKQSLDMKPVRIEELIHDLIDFYQDNINRKQIKIDIKKAEEQSVAALCDGGMIKNQVLSNIISNAIKFTPNNGEIQIHISFCPDYVRVCIQDSGQGIPEEIRSKIFLINKSTNRLGTDGEKGTGLGLPIAKRCLELMGGEISLLENAPEQGGARFELKLKRAH